MLIPPIESMYNKLAIGTVQFGMHYGVCNVTGKNSLAECASILALARKSSLDTLDTAIAYGDSESRLGEIGVDAWKVVSKLPPLPNEIDDVCGWVNDSVTGSLKRLRITTLYGLLLHRSGDLSGSRGRKLAESLQSLVDSGKVRKLGVSIYAPEELDLLARHATFDSIKLVQAPFNALDRRIETSGWLEKLISFGVEVHSRSAFLQGALLMPLASKLSKFSRWSKVWSDWEAWLQTSKLTAIQACLSVPLLTNGISRVVVGVDGSHHLEEILQSLQVSLMNAPLSIASDDLDLIDPSRWKLQ